MATEKYDVYISYNLLYRSAVEQIADRLAKNELNVWTDFWRIKLGDDWKAVAREALATNPVVLVILGPEGISPRGQTEELEIIFSSNVDRIVPVLLPNAPDNIVPASLKDRISMDLRAGLDNEKAFSVLLRGIHGEIPSSPYTQPGQEQTSVQAEASELPFQSALILMSGPSPHKVVDLSEDELIIGKDKSADFVINDEYVSRQHARVIRRNESFYLEDLGSTNGTFINGQRVTREQPLFSGDEILLGQNVKMNFIQKEVVKEKAGMLEDLSSIEEQRVYSLMTPRENIVSLDINDSVEKIRKTIDDNKFSHYPVQRGMLDYIEGIVDRDLLVQNLDDEDFSLKKILKPATSIPEPTLVSRAQELFEEGNELLLVIDEIGIPVGLLTSSDLSKAKSAQAVIEANRLINNRSQAVFNDQAQGEDQLGIKDEVDALAETLLLRDVEPPVAVGVMGGWGSGKSFVMHLVNHYVRATRSKAVKMGWPDGDEKDPKIPAYAGHIYQVNFNAWTYAKSNLWASLMDTIFTTLNRQMQLERLLAYRDFSPTDEPPTTKQIRENLLVGGDEFKKIYLENIQLDQDEDLTQEVRDNLTYWSQHLLKETLLWNVMRGQQVQTLEKLKDTEEQLNQLKTRREQFEKDRSLKGIKPESLENGTARQAYAQSLKSFMLAFLSDQLSETVKEELKKKDISDTDVKKYLDEVTGVWAGLKTLWRYFLWSIIFVALTFAIPPLWNAYALEFVQTSVAQIVSAIIAIVPVLTTILPWIKKAIEASNEAKKILEGAYTNQQAKHAEEIVNATDTPLSQKKSDLQGQIANGSVAAYDALINLLETQAEEQRQKIGPSAKYSNLMEFVQSRLDAATYENQLGLMHQVRQDIDELTFSLVDNANKDAFPRGKPRVILYIDDLDRCPPSRVVEVLEAVQLLLNTKLFIVVLGLDTRYVTRALEKEYKEILQHEGDPSGLDYIEKIIQIPYRVRPIETNSLQKYLKAQMEIEEIPSKDEASIDKNELPKGVLPEEPGAEKEETSGLAKQETEMTADGEAEHIPDKSQEKVIEGQDEAKGNLDENEIEEETELPAAVIRFKQEDLDDLAACCQKINLTPRSIKRMVNVLKLMKIFWFRAVKDVRIIDRDPPRLVKQAVISLLALSSAYPEVLREVFVQLEAMYRQGQEKTKLFDALSGIKLPPGSAREMSWQLKKYKDDLTALNSISGKGQNVFGQIELEELGFSTFNLVRSFSFVGDPVYWSNDEEEPPKDSTSSRSSRKTKPNRK